MPKSWINRNSDTAEWQDALAADGAQYQTPRFTVPQDDEDMFHGGAAQSVAGPMPCMYSRMDAEDQGMKLDAGPYFPIGRRAPETVSEALPFCMSCRMSDDIDASRFPTGCSFSRIGAEIETAAAEEITLLGASFTPVCFMPCRMSDDIDASRFPTGCSFSRIGAEIETAAAEEITLLGASFTPVCFMPCRMSAPEAELAAFPPGTTLYCRNPGDVENGADMDMTALADTIPYPCLPPRMPESMQASSAAQLPPPAYYCRQSR